MPGTEEQKTKLRLLLRVARWSLLAFALFWVIIGILALLPIEPNVDTLAFPEDLGGADPEAIVILVHGTFSPGADWTQPTSSIVHGIQRRFQGTRLQFYRFDWPGLFGGSLNNTHFQRYTASIKLAELVAKLRFNYPAAFLFVVAHSHGGNVALYAAMREPRVNAIVTMGTPFIEILPREAKDDIALLYSAKVVVFVAWYAMLLGSVILGIVAMGLSVKLFERRLFLLKVIGGVGVLISLSLMFWPVEYESSREVWVPGPAGQPGHYEMQTQYKISERAEKIRVDWNKAVIDGVESFSRKKQSDLAAKLNAWMPSNVAVLCLETKGGDEALRGLGQLVPKLGIFETLLSSPTVARTIVTSVMVGCVTAGLFVGGRIFRSFVSEAWKNGKLGVGMFSAGLLAAGMWGYTVSLLSGMVAVLALTVIAPLSLVLRAPAGLPYLVSYGSTDLLAEYVSTVGVRPEPMAPPDAQDRRCEVREYDFPEVPGVLKHSQYYSDPKSIEDIAAWLQLYWRESSR